MAIQVTGSKMPADNSYGQNGYTGPSSVQPAPKGALPSDDWMKRDVGKSGIADKQPGAKKETGGVGSGKEFTDQTSMKVFRG